jgi:hypothetical protein
MAPSVVDLGRGGPRGGAGQACGLAAVSACPGVLEVSGVKGGPSGSSAQPIASANDTPYARQATRCGMP